MLWTPTKGVVGTSTKVDIQKQIVDLLTTYKFKDADSIFQKYWDLFGFDIDEYEKYKAKFLWDYFMNNFYLKFWYDPEQLEAIASIHKNTLVTARAWSWKTQVIAGKTAYLLDSEKLDTSDILLLSFNKKAASEINNRIIQFGNISMKKNINLLTFENAMTFHSLAYKILWNDIKQFKLLMDTQKITDTKTWVEKEFKTNEQLRFIQNCFYDIYEWKIRKLMEKELKGELSYFKHSSYLDDDIKYYNYRKKREYLAFSGDYVRSKWEKVLIDLLFEYGFEVDYEPYINIGGNYLSKPDIRCNILKDGKKILSRDIIIEHWWFDKEDCFKKLPIWKSISWDKYAEIRKKKITYWKAEEQKWNYYFLQTKAKELYQDREWFLKNFKSQLQDILKQENIELDKVKRHILMRQLRRNDKQIFPFTKKLEHFINKSQQKHLTSLQIDEEVKNIQDKQERAFIVIANQVYRKYEEEKKIKHWLDFNQILRLSSEKLEKYKCDMDLYVWKKQLNLKQIKYLIIDEYQDFSTLFYMLLETILKYNKNCKIFVVWDSWQSINAFAGSELWYFFDFRKLFLQESTAVKKITTNYRSKQSIVEMWNNLMNFEWSWKADWLHGVNDWWEPYIYKNIRNFSYCENERINSIFNKWEDQKALEWAKYVFQNIIDIINKNKWKKIMVISRNNRVFWHELVDWRMKLYYYYFELLIKDFDIQKNPSNIEERLDWEDLNNYFKLDKLFTDNLEFITAHKSKWKEADIIILLDITEKKYPSEEKSLSEDVKYDRLFGVTPESLLKDERRLFYVAITRAKERIYILSDSNKNTWLLKELEKKD